MVTVTNISNMGIDYNWHIYYALDAYKNSTLIQDAVTKQLDAIGSKLRIGIYGASASGCMLLDMLTRRGGVEIACVVDRETPQNSLSKFPFVRADDVGSLQDFKLDALIFCVSPAHNDSMRELATKAKGVPLFCLMYKDIAKAAPTHTPFTERVAEYGFVFEALGMAYPQRLLEVGSGVTSLPDLIARGGIDVTAIDVLAGPAQNNPSYYVLNRDIQYDSFPNEFQMVTCISVLEHIPLYEAAMKSMVDSLVERGHLVLTIPLNTQEFVPNVYMQPGNHFYKPDCGTLACAYSLTMVRGWQKAFHLAPVLERYYRQYAGEGFGMGEPLPSPQACGPDDFPDLGCFLFRKDSAWG
ncbi:MAG: methyltransferase domain-containing protein [Humidesulfovibrio sp.]|nr:methyltransferase domain-containing protein [Humidesulfovibrio sp.]